MTEVSMSIGCNFSFDEIKRGQITFTEADSLLLKLLQQSMKTRNNLLPSFNGDAEILNRAIARLETLGYIQYEVMTGYFHVAN